MPDEKLGMNGLLSEGYGIAPKRLISNSDLSDGAFRLWALLSYYSRGGEACFPLQETLAQELNVRVETVSLRIKELCDAGFVIKERREESSRALKYKLNFLWGETVIPQFGKVEGTSPMNEKLKEYLSHRSKKRQAISKKANEVKGEARGYLETFYSNFPGDFKEEYQAALKIAGYPIHGIDAARFSLGILKTNTPTQVMGGVREYLKNHEDGLLVKVRARGRQLYNYVNNYRKGVKNHIKETAQILTARALVSPKIMPKKIRDEFEGEAFVPFEQRYFYECVECHTDKIEGMTEKCPGCKKYLDWNKILDLTDAMVSERESSIKKQTESFSWKK